MSSGDSYILWENSDNSILRTVSAHVAEMRRRYLQTAPQNLHSVKIQDVNFTVVDENVWILVVIVVIMTKSSLM